ncbi:hypothetical protein IEQ34_011833 [Dendrobium chrysotoxum]|uniref:Uncharacterized protein n=1 Tax=Dendrobium chrysotoxum TaxID=161865 RepID=A0AAV7GTY9_DENCH|nr:hypothetical protein IEQ34_011833 [Dendrobium chrysotoxum]
MEDFAWVISTRSKSPREADADAEPFALPPLPIRPPLSRRSPTQTSVPDPAAEVLLPLTLSQPQAELPRAAGLHWIDEWTLSLKWLDLLGKLYRCVEVPCSTSSSPFAPFTASMFLHPVLPYASSHLHFHLQYLVLKAYVMLFGFEAELEDNVGRSRPSSFSFSSDRHGQLDVRIN